MNRTKNEKFADVALLLYLIGLFRSKSGLYLGITKLDKLTFLSEKEMLDQTSPSLLTVSKRYGS
jgi:hypothetical protein